MRRIRIKGVNDMKEYAFGIDLGGTTAKVGLFTTSYGLGGAIPFALELVRQLAGEAEADRIRSAIAYRH